MTPRGLAVAMLALAACAREPARDGDWERNAERLSGRWLVRVEFASSGVPGDARRGASTSGTMILSPNRAVSDPVLETGIPTNYGTYEIDFSRLGFEPSGTRVPAVFVGVAHGDSVEIAFESDRVGFTMRMTGVIANDSIRGRWSAVLSRGTIGAGPFLMTRR